MSSRPSSFRSRSRARQSRLSEARKRQGIPQARPRKKSPFSMESYGGMALLLVVVTSAIAFLQVGFPVASQQELLRVYCSSIHRAAIRNAAAEDPQIPIELILDPPEALLRSRTDDPDGALWIVAGDRWVAEAQHPGNGWIGADLPSLRPALLVDVGNPKGLSGLSDLLREDLRVSLARPGRTVLGTTTRNALEGLDLWAGMQDAIKRNGVFKDSETELARDVLLGLVDAAIVWTDAEDALDGRAEILLPPGLRDVRVPVRLLRPLGGEREAEARVLMERVLTKASVQGGDR